jgi:Archease protein family (MTH1598/TM1083)
LPIRLVGVLLRTGPSVSEAVMVRGVARRQGRVRGHRTRAHTGDVIVEAWGPTREACLEEAALGLVGAFADVSGLAPSGRVGLTLSPADVEETLVAPRRGRVSR